MSLKIKIPKSSAGPSSQAEEPAIRRKSSKRRSRVLESSDEYDEDDMNMPLGSKPTKRARTEERSVGDVEDVDVEADEEVNVDVPVDTRFLPQAPVGPGSRRNSAKKEKPPTRRPKKRAVVLSDDEGGEEDYEDNQDVVVDDDDDFTPEPVAPKRVGASKTKARSGKPAVSEKKIPARVERKVAIPVKRGVSGEDDEDDMKVDIVETAPKKRKLPPIKKNKPSTGTSTPSTVTAPKPSHKVPPPPSTSALDGLALPASGARKPAATANNADFDLRDKSVYASLFMKPGGATPNSGLSRKEKEEERRKELNKMREDARAKRATVAKESFDLQAPQEKIARFERRLRARVGEAAVMYPNILGGAFRDAMEATKGLRMRPQPSHRGS